MSKARKDLANSERERGESAMANFTRHHPPVPRPLQEAEELLSSINNRLEECSVEWQAVVSRKQWLFVDSNANSLLNKPWQSTILARRYFIDRTLDGAFKTLLSSSKLFSDHLRNFIELLQNIKSAANRRESLLQIRPKTTLRGDDECGSNVPETQASANTKRAKRPTDGKAMATIRNSFVDVVKAKVDFDVKFLGFESVLHGSSSALRLSTNCLCQVCSNVTGSVVEVQSNGRSDSLKKQPTKTVRRSKRKRLTRSARTLTRRRNRRRATLSSDYVGGDRASPPPSSSSQRAKVKGLLTNE